jgi:hypothetical protein
MKPKFYTFLVFFLFFSEICISQVKEHFKTTQGEGFFEKDSYWVLKDSIIRYDLGTEEFFRLKPDGFSPSKIQITDSGIYYYIIYYVNDKKRYAIYFLSNDFKENRFVFELNLINSIAATSDDQHNIIFTGTSINNEQGIWKSDGTSDNTYLYIKTNITDIANFRLFHNKVFYTTTKDNIVNFYIDGIQISNPSLEIYRRIDAIFNHNGKLYFTLRKHNDLSQDLCMLNHDLSFELLYTDLPLLNLYPVNSDTLYFDQYSSQSKTLDIYYFSNKTLKSIKLDQRIADGHLLRSYLNNNILVLRHKNIGQELAQFKGDSLVIIEDFNPGPMSGYKSNFFDASASSIIMNSPSIPSSGIFEEDTLYAVMSNGNDAKNYVYQVVNNQFKSICEARGDEFFRFKHNNLLYYTKNLSGHILLSIDLNKNETQPENRLFDVNNWYKQFNIDRPDFFSDFRTTGRVFNTDLDDKGDAILTVSTDIRQILTPPDTFIPYNLTNNNIIKVDSRGNLKWVCNISGFNEGLWTGQNYPRQVIDSKGNVIVVGFVFLDGMLGKDTILHNGQNERIKHFIAKINGVDGNVIWYKLLDKSEFIGPYMDAISIDENDNVYLAMVSRKFIFDFGGKQISSNISPFNVLLKFDTSGTIEWMSPMNNLWTDQYGQTYMLGVSKKNKSILSQQTQGSPNVRSSCKYKDWGYVTQIADMNGKVKLSANYSSDDVGWIQTGVLDEKGAIHSFGIWRGELNVNAIFPPLQTPDGKDCNENENFYTITDPDVGIPVELFRTKNRYLEPIQAKFHNEHIYLLASVKGIAYLFKFKSNGTYVGNRNLEFGISGNTSVRYTTFDVKNGSILLAGYRLSQSKELGIPFYFWSRPRFSIVKTEDKNWDNSDVWFERITPIENDNQKLKLFVFPNPTNDYIKIVYDNNKDFKDFEILNINGQCIKKGKLSEIENEINVSELTQGVYIVQISGASSKENAKFIKL